MTLFQKAILSTIVYYDTMNHPLTSFEVFKYLVNPLHIAEFYSSNKTDNFKSLVEIEKFSKISLVNVRKSLNSKELKKFIQEKQGFYFLKNRKNIIRTRINGQKIADQKWKKAEKIINWLQIIPYIRMIGVNGSLALKNTREDSDIDVLIVIKSGRIWLTRFFVSSFLQLIGRRRHKNITKDRICLNHYITDKSLGIEYTSLSNAQINARLIPVLETKSGTYNKFQKANSWIKLFLVFYPKTKIKNSKYLKTNSLLKSIAKFGETCLNNKIGDFIESLFKKLEKRLVKKNPLTYKKGGRVIVNDKQLEFHPNAREREVLDKYNGIMVELGISKLGQEKDSGLL